MEIMDDPERSLSSEMASTIPALYDILSAGNFENRLCRVLGEEDVSENHGRGGGERFLRGRLAGLPQRLLMRSLSSNRESVGNRKRWSPIFGAPLFPLVE
jgi:hypothetical protein